MTYKVLIVDDEPNNLQLLRQILKDEYQLLFANNGRNAISAVQRHQPDLILLDVMMPDINGFDVCKTIKQDSSLASIPIIFVTAMGDVEDESLGFDLGAVDYIHKPISGSIVKRRVKTHLSLVRVAELEEANRSAITMLGEAGHYNDTDTGLHIWRMAAYSVAIAKEIGWDCRDLELLEFAATLHDTGKIGVPDEILKAPRALTESEWITMKMHTSIGYDILRRSSSPVFSLASEIAYCHHEKWDGTGYPRGLSGTDIPESARIVALADVFDALTMERCYKKAWSMSEAADEIIRLSGSHFEPRIVDVFKTVFDELLEIKKTWTL